MIIQNQIRCNKCGDEPYSAYRWDYKYCKCGAVAVDGGMDYLKRVGDVVNTTELSIFVEDETIDQLRSAIRNAAERECNSLGTICAIMRVLRDNGYDLEPKKPKEPTWLQRKILNLLGVEV